MPFIMIDSPLPLFQFKTSATFVNNSAGGTNMTFPASILPGDLIVMWDTAEGPNVPAFKLPPGFNSGGVADTYPGSPGNPAGIIFGYKFADASDAGRTYNGMNANAMSATVIMVFNSSTRPFTNYSSGSPDFDLGAGGAPPGQTIVAGVAPNIAFGLYMQSGGTFSPGFSPGSDGFATAATTGTFPILRASISYKIFNSAPVNIAVSLGTNVDTSCLACIRIDGS